MATSLLYLGPCLGLCSILVTAGSGGVCVYNYCSYYSCYRVAGAVIEVASSIAIRTTYSAAVKIASKIGGAANRISRGFYKDSY